MLTRPLEELRGLASEGALPACWHLPLSRPGWNAPEQILAG